MTGSGNGVYRSALRFLATVVCSAACSAPQPIPEPPLLVAHAGGIGNHRTYTNSLEAVQGSAARGHTLIELDFSWTTDNRLVLVHDWDREFSRIFARPPGQLSFDEFRALRSPFGVSQLTVDDLRMLLESHQDLDFVTDIKDRNIEGLSLIAKRFSGFLGRFVPQIYHPDELATIRDMGFDRIIFTLYKSQLTDREVVDFANLGRPWAVTMPVRRAMFGDLASRLNAASVPVYAHTVNDQITLDALRRVGVHGIYTDWLSPTDGEIVPDTSPWLREFGGATSLGYSVVPIVPWAMRGLDLALAFHNHTTERELMSVRVVGSEGSDVELKEIEVPEGVRSFLDLSGLQPSSGRGWLMIEGPPALELAVQQSFLGGPLLEEPVQLQMYESFVTGGSGRGVGGLLLAIVNPTARTQSYHLQRRIGEELIDDEAAELGPRNQLYRLYHSATDEWIEISVSGGPMVAATMRWDPQVRFVW